MIFSKEYLQNLALQVETHCNVRLDAGETATLARQLEHVYAKTYDVLYTELKARRLVPLDTTVDNAADYFTYQQWDSFGMAKIISNYADDLPRVDALAREFTSPLKSIGSSYAYNIQDMRRSAKAGNALPQRRAKIARRAHELAFDDIVAFGNADAGLGGFLNHANVPIVSAVTGQWVTNSATPLQMIADLNALVDSIVLVTKETFVPDTLVLDNKAFQILNSTPMSSTGDADKTVLRFFLDNNPYIKTVEQWNKLNAAGAGGTSRAVAYKRSEEVLAAVESQPFEQFPPQWRNFEAVIATHSRVGGVRVQYPLAIAYMDDLAG